MLAVRGDRGSICMAVVTGDQELDPKALARLTGDRKVELVPLKDVQQLTGYIRGGVTAICAKRITLLIDETVHLFDVISRPAFPGHRSGSCPETTFAP